MAEAVCVAGEDFPHAVVSRLLKLESAHIRFVLDCLQENAAQVRNMVLATAKKHYASKISHDFYSTP